MTRPTKPNPRRMRSFLAWAVVDTRGEVWLAGSIACGTLLQIYSTKSDRSSRLLDFQQWQRVRVMGVAGKGIKK